MSAIKTTDQKISEAKQEIAKAYKNLLIVLDEDTYGHNDLTNSYIDTIQEVAAELLKLKRKL